MNKKIHILLLEDVPAEARLIWGLLQKELIDFEGLVVNTDVTFIKALNDFSPDIILCNHIMQRYNSYKALSYLKEANITVPFILITSIISEEFALDVLKRGADDYILKDRLERLPVAINRLLEKCLMEKERKDILHNQAHLAAIVNASNDGIISKTLDGTITSWNPSAENLFGYSMNEAIGKNITMLIPEDRLHEEITSIATIKSGKHVQHFETIRLTKNGEKVHVLVAISPLKDSFGKVTGAAKIVHNITARKQLEDLLNKTNQLARIGSWEVNLVNNSLYMSDITKELHEVDKGFIPDMKIAVNFYKEGADRDRILKAVQEAINTGAAYDLQLQIITAKGNERWVRTIGNAEFHNGKCIRLMGSFQDIDAIKKSEIEILKAYEEKNIILESIGDAFYALDKNWVVTYWNKEAEKLLSITKEEIIGRNLWDVFPERIGSDIYKLYMSVAKTNEVINTVNFNSRFGKWFEITAYPSLTGISVFFKDVTERKNTETILHSMNERLEKSAKELAVSNAELEQFAYVASHDLQEPLRMVTSFLTLLEKKYNNIIDEKGKEYINFAVDGSKRMRQIILDLLEFSRIGKAGEGEEDIDLNILVHEILALYTRQVEEKKATIQINKLPVIKSFKTPMRQVFQNLISNALKYHRDGVPPEINISASDTGKFFKFVVADNGIGIGKAYLDTIFIIFQRLHTKEKYPGTGIGLAITKKIIEGMGGNIWVESEEQKGTAFYFTIAK